MLIALSLGENYSLNEIICFSCKHFSDPNISKVLNLHTEFAPIKIQNNTNGVCVTIKFYLKWYFNF